MAFGAMGTSIGLSTALRHTVGAGSRAFAQQDRSPRVLVGSLLSWIRGSQLAQMVRDDRLLDCGCPICYGRSLRRFVREDAESVREAATQLCPDPGDRSWIKFSTSSPARGVRRGSSSAQQRSTTTPVSGRRAESPCRYRAT
jgi:hypothetical protein